MSDQTTTDSPAEAAEQQELDVTPEDMISRGKGLRLEAIEEGTPAAAAVAEFRELEGRLKAAEGEFNALKEERNQAIYNLKETHNVSFGAMAEIIGATSSLVLYLYERAQGKTAKQIREESQRSAAAKAKFRPEGSGKPGRKQSPEEKAFRKQQREALKQFLAEHGSAGGEGDGEGEEEADADE